MINYNKIHACRICGGTELKKVYSLGNQAFSGVFSNELHGPEGELTLIQCASEFGCGLVQLDRDFDQKLMYGAGYGYRSGLNPMMVKHLEDIMETALQYCEGFGQKSLKILDIGSNDGTLLNHFGKKLGKDCLRVGIDPSSENFKQYYDKEVVTSSDFFSKETFLNLNIGKSVDVVTSIAMFYDLPYPLQIVKDISNILAEDGIWVVEQSYLPLMLATNSFDTICHEHTEYYALKQFQWMCAQANLEIINISFNQSNGGSFRLVIGKTVDKSRPSYNALQFSHMESLLEESAKTQFESFEKRVVGAKQQFVNFIKDCADKGKSVCALGASTKGNTLLQNYGITSEVITVVGEINPVKFGKLTPGTHIPIVPEIEVLGKFDYYIVLPWHFKENFITNSKYQGLDLVFLLPNLEVISCQ